MPSNTVNFKRRVWVVPVVLFVVASPLRWLERQPAPTETLVEQMAGLSGQGGLTGILGGMRPVLAGGFWLRANLAWERQDAAATMELIELTVAADGRPAYFWLNGARMIACDMPAWLPADVPESVRQRRTEELAQRALGFLEKGLRWHGPDADLYVEMANIHWRRRGDLAAAARYYGLAAGQPGAPGYAARIHAGLLRELAGR